MKQIRRHVTYANVMSSFAVFLILGGATAFAAVQKIGANELKANSVKTGKLVKEAVKRGKLAKNAVDSTRVENGSLLAEDFKAGQLPAGPKGETGPAGPPGSALAYALISAGGNVDPAGSKGITDADVDLDSTGTYCFSKLPAGTKSIVATANGQFLSSTESDRFVSVSFIPTNPSPNWSGCSSGDDSVRVTTFDQSAAALTNTAFMIWFED